MVEYALILVLVAVVVVAILFFLGPTIGEAFSTVNDSLENADAEVEIEPTADSKSGKKSK